MTGEPAPVRPGAAVSPSKVPVAGRRLRRLRRAAAALAAAVVACALALIILDRRHPFPLGMLEAPLSAEVRSGDGVSLGRRVAADGQWRLAAEPYGDWLPLATVAVEDERFWRHPGVDPIAVVRAAASNLARRRVHSGASTLTMQLVGLRLPQGRTFAGKALEALRALQLERSLSKAQILERYLALAPYGRNLCGAGAAARYWFGKAPEDLALHEAALLAGLPQSPSRLRPDRHPERALARRNRVLERMRVEGMIDEAACKRARSAPLQLASHEVEDAAFHAVARAFIRRPDGARITVELDVQREIERIVGAHAGSLPRGCDIAAVALDVERARVLAWVGSADPTDPVDGQNDGVLAWRSPGSALKPFVYGAAFECGRLAPNDMLQDRPLEVGGWSPRNFDRGFAGEVSVREALVRSLNVPAIEVARRVGLERCVGVVEAVGVRLEPTATTKAGLAFVTGGSRVRLLDLVEAYATLARGGVYRPATLFDDEVSQGPGTRALSSETCEALFDLLSDAHRSPQVRAGASQVGGLGLMWKTGTSSGHADAWAVGHDRRVALGVWVGRFDGRGDARLTGREAAEPILAEVFASPALRDP